MNLPLSILNLNAAVDSLLVQFPELREDESLRADTLTGATDIDTLLSKIVAELHEAEAMVEAIDRQMTNLNERGKRFARKQEAMRSLIATVMERASLNKFVLPESTLSLSFRKSPPVITDEAKLPEECTKLVRTPDRAVIKQWCENGNVPEGVSLSNGKMVLAVRSR